MIIKCRICTDNTFAYTLLNLKNMPKAAQFLPDAETVSADAGEDLEVCQCSRCGLVQLSNEPVPYYREVIRSSAFSQEMHGFREKQFREFVQKHSLAGKKVVEVGCGRGEYLSILHESEADAYGLEHSQEAVQACIAEGLKVVPGYVNNADQKLTNGPFDAFFIMSFLEHMPDPNATLKGICNNLSEDAVGLVEVPNFDMILRNNLFSEFISDHLLYFTEETLCNTLSRNGFEVITCDSVWHDYILSATIRKRKPLDLGGLRTFQEKIRGEMSEFVDRFPEGGVAVWGAGHQALAVLALTGLKERIRYVVDSAPFKQSKFTPATHIPIVTPQTLREDPVDAVVVMAAAYSNEVAGIMQTDYSHVRHVAVLEDAGLRVLSL